MPVPKPNKGEEKNKFLSRCNRTLAHIDPHKSREQRNAMCYSAWEAHLESPSRIKCMRCDDSPTVDVLHANGMGRAWFCDVHFEEWKKESFNLRYGGEDHIIINKDDIDKVYKVKDGIVPKKWSQRTKFQEITTDDILRKRLYPTLPSACKCGKCDYVLKNPKKHCNEISCPKCGGRMWRVKVEETLERIHGNCRWYRNGQCSNPKSANYQKIVVAKAEACQFFTPKTKLERILPGIYLIPPHAELIWKKEKNLIVKTKTAPAEYMNTSVYFIENHKCFGILKITKVSGPYTASKVRERLRHRHKISDKEWSDWAKDYPTWNQKVYVYEFKVVERFSKPKDFEPAPGTQVWIKEVELENPYFIVTAESFISDTDLAPVAGSGIETHSERVSWKDVIPRLKPFFFLKPAIMIMGGAVTRDKEGGTKHDIEWLVNFNRRVPERDKAIEFRIGRQFPKLAEHFNYHYRNIGGPFTDHIPAYDFLALPSDWKKPVRMEEYLIQLEAFLREETLFVQLAAAAQPHARKAKEQDKVTPLEFVLPAKPTIGHKPGERYTPESVADLFKEDEYPVLAEKKYDGNLLILCKQGDQVKIYRISGVDCSSRLPSTVKEMKSWPHTVTVVSDTEKWTAKGEYVGRELVAGYLSGKTAADDSGIVHNLFDCIYFYDPKMQKHDLNCQAGDIHKEDLLVRKRYLEALPVKQKTGDEPSIKTHFNVAPYITCRNRKELIAGIKKCSAFEASEGSVLKRTPKSPYPLTGRAYTQAKYKKTADVHGIVLKVLARKTPGVFGYRVGVKIPTGWKVTRTGKIGNKEYMDVGKTGNIKRRLSVGTIVIVNYEELFFYRDPETDERQVVLYVPEIVSWRPEQTVPDTAEEAVVNAEKFGVLVKKSGRLSYARSQMESIKLW